MDAGWGLALPAVPFALALVGFFTNRRLAAALGIAGAAVSLGLAIALAATVDTTTERSWQWVDLGGLKITLGTRLDPAAISLAANQTAEPEDVVDAAFLVDRDRSPEFEEAVEQVGTDVHPRIRLRLLGPLAPYDFVPEG